MDIALGRLVLDLLKELRTILGNRTQRAEESALGMLLSLLGSTIKLKILASALANELTYSSTRREAGLTNHQAKLAQDFLRELGDFGEALSRVNLYAIEVYYPGFMDSISRAFGAEHELIGLIDVEKLVKSRKEASKLEKIFVENFAVPGYGWKSGNESLRPFRRVENLASIFWPAEIGDNVLDEALLDQRRGEMARLLRDLATVLESCQILTSTILRENWKLQDIL